MSFFKGKPGLSKGKLPAIIAAHGGVLTVEDTGERLKVKLVNETRDKKYKGMMYVSKRGSFADIQDLYNNYMYEYGLSVCKKGEPRCQ